jgi:hypothetical protein
MARQPHERRAHQKGQHDANQAGDDGRREESELESGYPGGQIGQIACLGRGGEREHARDIGAHPDEAHMAQRKDTSEAIGQPHGDHEHGIDAHDGQNADEIVVHQRRRGEAEQTQQYETGDDDKEALHPAHSFTS